MAVDKEVPFLNICLGCMSDKGSGPRCMECGFDEARSEVHELRIRPRTVLRNQYLVGKVLGQGGFGITYLGLDLVLNKKVAIKEFLPSGLATRKDNRTTVVPFTAEMEQFFRKYLHSFLGEARNVAKFSRHQNIVNVNNYFEENETGYIVMDYLEGESVSSLMNRRRGRIPTDEAFSIMFPILDALSEVHKAGIFHRDVSPQNIIVTSNGTPVLIDFGAARQVLGEESRSLDIILKHGYSPLEQYTLKGFIGPWSDVYACGATLYHMLTGILPPPSVDRIYSDDLVQPRDVKGLNISEELNDAILTSLAVKSSDRFQSVEELRKALEKKPYTGYRQLLDSFLKGGTVSLEDRMNLDKYIVEHGLDYGQAESLEENLRHKLGLPPLDWLSEYRENYETCCRNYAESGMAYESDENFYDTYISTRRVSHAKAVDIVKDYSESSGGMVYESGEKAHERYISTGRVSRPKAIDIVEDYARVRPAPGRKLMIAMAATFGCIVIAVASYFIFKPGHQYGYINVWSNLSAEIFVNGKFVGISPQSKIKAPAGEVKIRILNKEHGIDQTYLEYVDPVASD